MRDFIRIPEERLKIFKGYEEKLEKIACCKIEVDEEIAIEAEDPLMVLRVKEVIKAFGRGFDFDSALDLLDEDYCLETINVKDFSGKSKSRMITLKGRVIGTEGKTKRLIEKTTNVKIAIYGKTISMIGKWEEVQKAKKAVDALLSGKKHSTAYRLLMED